MSLWLRIVIFALLAALPASHAAAQSFLGEESGPIIAPPGSEPIEVPPSDIINADEYVGLSDPYGHGGDWQWQTLPQGLIYRSYFANPKEPRMYGGIDDATHDNLLWNGTVGARLGIFRYGTTDYILPDGWQLDVEGAAQVRLDIPEDVDVRSVDFRCGVPLTYGMGAHRFKTGYYHLSSHLGDEFVYKNPYYNRLNFARDVLLLGYSYYATPNLRLYGEAGWAFYSIVSEPWEFQFGLDYAPSYRTGPRGAPFFAVNGHIREELNFSGNFTAQAGWAWRADNGPQLLRVGVQYFNGLSNQYSFAFDHEETIGVGIWYDF